MDVSRFVRSPFVGMSVAKGFSQKFSSKMSCIRNVDQSSSDTV